MDGTFNVAPPQFAQLYTVHGLSNGHHVVGCYALLPNKQRNTYVLFLRQVQLLTNGASPATIMIDYEQACIGAIPLVFPNATAYGCYFHLCKSVFRHVQEAGLQEQYMVDEEFRTNIRMLPSLAFVPIADIITAFEDLSQHCQHNEQVILDYFETTYIGELRRGRRRAPLFAHEFWNINQRVVDNLPRTTNALEGWHRSFNHSFSVAHPNIWIFINGLKRDAAIQQVRAGHYVAGRPAPKRRRIYERVNDNIMNLVADYGNRQNLDFLRGISYNITH